MKTSILIGLLMCVALPTWGQETKGAQDVQEGVVGQRMIVAATSDQEGGGEIQVFSTSSIGGDAVYLANPMMGGWSPDAFSLVNNTGVQKEVELLDDQLQQIRDIQKNFSQRMSERMKSFTSGGFKPEDGKKLREVIEEMNEEQRVQLENVLLPHQVNRLKQIALQVQMQNAGEMAALNSKQVSEALGIDEQQKRRLEARAKQIKEEMDQKIKQLKEEAKKELLGELTRDQRSKLDEMIGSSFELKQPDFRQRLRNVRRPTREKQ